MRKKPKGIRNWKDPKGAKGMRMEPEPRKSVLSGNGLMGSLKVNPSGHGPNRRGNFFRLGL